MFADKYLLYIRIRTVSVRKISYALSFSISFQNISRENVCLTFGHLVSQARARQSYAVVRLTKWFLTICSPAFFIYKITSDTGRNTVVFRTS